MNVKCLLLGLVLATLFFRCNKGITETGSELKDTVVAGQVFVYDGFGKPVSPQPIVNVTAFQADTLGNVLYEMSVSSNEMGDYVFDSLPIGTYSLLFETEDYGEYIANSIAFDGLEPKSVQDVYLAQPASGQVYLHDIVLKSKNLEAGIVEFDREIVFGEGSNEPFMLKTRYLFGLDSSVTEGNSFYSFVSGAVEGRSGESNRMAVKFALVNLKTYIPDSTTVFVVVALEDAVSSSYLKNGTIVYPNVTFPLYPVHSFEYIIPKESDDEVSE